MIKRLVIGSAAAVGAAAVLLFGGVFTQSQARSLSVDQLDRRANEFAQRGRDTGDVTYYAKADAAYRRVLHAAPRDLPATIGLGALALSRHDFGGGLVLGRRAVQLSSTTAAGYGVVGDALVELGNYKAAFATFNKMVSLKPSVSSYARISYARELLGDYRGAVAAMQLAVDAAIGEAEALAWTRTQLGKLYWGHGNVRRAAFEYRVALRARPGYAPALDALAQVEAARGRLSRAIALAQRAAAVLPLPQHVANLGDLLRAAGDRADARRQYALVAAIARLQRAGGVNVDLESALFDIDHGIDLSRAIARARTARAARPSIDGDDVLAWALARNGRCHEALHYSRRALRLGTQDAPKFFHRAMIERCLGDRLEARTWFRRTLRLNPHFSLLWTHEARKGAA
jgi:tetratricopeptide (TPR) repeat protein